jgi:hypothetical protein
MKTRFGITDDVASGARVTPTSPVFTARDRSGHLTEGRYRQGRVPAR